MLRVIAVDDENTALQWFQRVAATNPSIQTEGLFLHAEDAIAHVYEQNVDVAFLDIEMPEMCGLDLAEMLLEIDPYIKVVFVTAYNQYALEAFRVHAIGYLLKPLDRDDFNRKIDHMICTCVPRAYAPAKRLLHVTCFGQFSVRLPEDTRTTIHWKTAKAEELFALLVYYQGRVRSKDNLIDTLWPENEPEKAANLFRVTCTYIRSALADIGFTNVIVRELDGYKVNTELLECDLFSFRRVIHAYMSESLDNIEAASLLYGGEYLEGKAYEWASSVRTEMESAFKKLQSQLAQRYLSCGNNSKAYQALEKIYHYDPCDEEIVMRLIQMRLQNGEVAAARKVYQLYRHLLEKEYGELPPSYIQDLFTGLSESIR